MNQQNNLPPGAEQSAHNPWERDTTLCPYCDKREIEKEIRAEMIATFGEDYEDLVTSEDYIAELRKEYELCEPCAKEKYFDV